MYTYVVAMLVSAALAGIGAWNVQNWRYGNKEKERVEQVLAIEKEQRRFDNERSKNVIAAQNAAAGRVASLRADAALARNELDGLRQLSDATIATSRTSLDACVVTATTHAELFANCAARYQDLGAKADAHASDVKTLMDAWPKE
jgi:type II secretory pathway pseudopilin PulG